MHLRTLVLAAACLAIVPAGTIAAPGPAPKPRKTVTTTKSATTKAAPKADAAAKVRTPRHLAKLRKGKVPDASARVHRKRVAKPSKRLVPVAAARKPVRMKSLPKAAKVSFVPCAASLPPQAPQPTKPKAGMDGAVFDRQNRWPTGATLKIGFVDGSRAAREAVAQTARAWQEHANLVLDFSLDAPPADPDILIRFDAIGCTSHVGTSSRYYAEIGEPSMHLCGMDQWLGSSGFDQVVLHEFGHALGLLHEHQSPNAAFQWNKLAVYDFYGTSYGWDRDYVDMWVFRQIEPHGVDASQYDPDSIMHYAFPAEFTTNGVAFGGSSTLSVLDKQLITKEYPRSDSPKVRRRFERKIAVRNETGEPLDVQLVVETRQSGKPKWKPASDPTVAPVTRVAAGAELALDGQGRRVKLVARSTDGRASWSEHAEEALRIAPKGGYLDTQLQTYVVVIDGAPDQPGGQSPEQLYAAGAEALAAGEHEAARELFAAFAQQFPADPLAPWARFNVALSWYDQERWEEALQSSYELIVAYPNADATIYAWYYGGVSSVQLGWCDGARGYLEYVNEDTSGAPDEWRDSAGQYLAAMKSNPDRWCW
jgi:serralysin